MGELLLFKHLLKYVTSGKCEQPKTLSDPAIWAATGAVRSISPQQWEFKACTAHPGPSLPSCTRLALSLCHSSGTHPTRKGAGGWGAAFWICVGAGVAGVVVFVWVFVVVSPKKGNPKSGHATSWTHSLQLHRALGWHCHIHSCQEHCWGHTRVYKLGTVVPKSLQFGGKDWGWGSAEPPTQHRQPWDSTEEQTLIEMS